MSGYDPDFWSRMAEAFAADALLERYRAELDQSRVAMKMLTALNDDLKAEVAHLRDLLAARPIAPQALAVETRDVALVRVTRDPGRVKIGGGALVF